MSVPERILLLPIDMPPSEPGPVGVDRLQEDPTGESTMTGANDDVIMSHQTTDIDSASHDAESLPHVISQLAATSNLMLCQSLHTIAALFANVSDTDDSITESSCEFTFDEICDALEQKNIIDNCVTLDGTYGDFIDPFAFRARRPQRVIIQTYCLVAK